MNSVETGRLIAALRRSAGYTQASLAKALFVTDKAVSKWERGLCMPDFSILPALARLLDVDVEILLSGKGDGVGSGWHGLLLLDDKTETAVDTVICDKPLLFYLMSYFALAGIRDIEIRSFDIERINALHLSEYGFNISFSPLPGNKVMVVYEKALVFGANLTRYFQSFLSQEHDIVPTVDGRDVPILFLHGDTVPETAIRLAERKPMTRGMVLIPMDKAAEAAEAAQFVRIYQKYHGLSVCDVAEICKKRGLL